MSLTLSQLTYLDYETIIRARFPFKNHSREQFTHLEDIKMFKWIENVYAF